MRALRQRCKCFLKYRDAARNHVLLATSPGTAKPARDGARRPRNVMQGDGLVLPIPVVLVHDKEVVITFELQNAVPMVRVTTKGNVEPTIIEKCSSIGMGRLFVPKNRHACSNPAGNSIQFGMQVLSDEDVVDCAIEVDID